MTKDEARAAIRIEWVVWARATKIKNATGADALLFFNYLQAERPDLLAFKASGDKWQVVHSWLLKARLVADRRAREAKGRSPRTRLSPSADCGRRGAPLSCRALAASLFRYRGENLPAVALKGQ